MAITPDDLKAALLRRVGMRSPPVQQSQGNPLNLLRMLQLIRQSQARPVETPEDAFHKTLQLHPQQPQWGSPIGIPETPDFMQQHPMTVMSQPSSITKLPQQHSQIGAISPMQQAAQQRLNKKPVGMMGMQGNFNSNPQTSGYTGGGTESAPAGAKQQKHRKVTIEEYR